MSVSQEEFREALAKLDEKFVSKQTFEIILEHISNSISDRILLKISKDSLMQLTELKVLLTQINTELSNVKEDLKQVNVKIEEQEDKTNIDIRRVDRLEQNQKYIRRNALGVSEKGQPPTLREQLTEAQITIKEHENRLITLEKFSPKNYELMYNIREQNEILSIYNIIILFISKTSFIVKKAFKAFLISLAEKRKTIFETIAQSLLIKILLFLIGLIVASPLWTKIVEEVLKIIFVFGDTDRN